VIIRHGKTVHLRHSLVPVNGTITGTDLSGFTVTWDSTPRSRGRGNKGGRYRYLRTQAYLFGEGYRRDGDS